jgi:hypothetical protein
MAIVLGENILGFHFLDSINELKSLIEQIKKILILIFDKSSPTLEQFYNHL